MSDEAKKTAHLFQKGQSGNPGGRPKGLERTTREAMATRSYVAKDGNKYEGIDAATQCLLDMLFDEKTPPRVRVHVYQVLTNRGWGSPKQTVELVGDRPSVRPARDPDDMTDAEISTALKAIETLRELGAVAGADPEGDAVSEH